MFNYSGYFLYSLIIAVCNFYPKSEVDKNELKFHKIPDQTIDYLQIMGVENEIGPKLIEGFEISGLITYGQYKEYLESVKRDSTEEFYLSQLPDSNMCLPECYKEYTSGNKYDDYPVVGVSWLNARNYCRWKTKQDDLTEYEYRMPWCKEWVAAFTYLEGDNIDLNKDYSEWLLNAKDETLYNPSFWEGSDPFRPYIYEAKASDPPALKRKFVIGASFHRRYDKLYEYYGDSYYSFEGYRYVSFRMVKVVKGR